MVEGHYVPDRPGRDIGKQYSVAVDADPIRGKEGRTAKKTRVNTTTGWSPSCACPAAEPIPATVLDPFSGAATTGVVALEEGRNYVGIELNAEYQEGIARSRLVAAKTQADEMANQLTLAL